MTARYSEYERSPAEQNSARSFTGFTSNPSQNGVLEPIARRGFSNVLLVESDVLVALDLTDDLKRWGYCVTGIVSNSTRALECASVLRPDFAIIDVALDEQNDGIRVADTLKQLFSSEIVFLTGHSDTKTRALINSVNPAGYLFKPYSAFALHALLKGMGTNRTARYPLP